MSTVFQLNNKVLLYVFMKAQTFFARHFKKFLKVVALNNSAPYIRKSYVPLVMKNIQSFEPYALY